jgi:nucleoside 2-deoxyribosyltransferase
MKVYIAGPMSGYPDNNFAAFDSAAEALRQSGHEVVSPADMNRAAGFTPNRKPTPKEYADFMREDIKAILSCDAIAMLPFWRLSKGASFEHSVAEMIGLQIMMLEDCSPEVA